MISLLFGFMDLLFIEVGKVEGEIGFSWGLVENGSLIFGFSKFEKQNLRIQVEDLNLEVGIIDIQYKEIGGNVDSVLFVIRFIFWE